MTAPPTFAQDRTAALIVSLISRADCGRQVARRLNGKAQRDRRMAASLADIAASPARRARLAAMLSGPVLPFVWEDDPPGAPA